MPALTLYGRRWYTTSDMLPLPAALFAALSLVWLVVFGVVIGNLDVWRGCTGSGQHYVVTTAGLVAVYGLSFCLETGIVALGLRGTCFEVRKRRPVVLLLYAQTFVWLVQAILMVYGTVIMYKAEPICNAQRSSTGSVKHLTHAMVWSTWGLVGFLLVIVYLVYNSYQSHDSLRSWEKRLRSMSLVLRCREVVNTPADGRGAPLPDIAQWISGLFANVDLSPTDLTEAVILTAAAQSMRRKMRIKKALAAASSDLTDVTSETNSMPSTADLDSLLSNDFTTPSIGQDRNRQVIPEPKEESSGFSGALECKRPGEHQTVALPEDYPQDYREMADSKYSQTAQKLQSEVTQGSRQSNERELTKFSKPDETGLSMTLQRHSKHEAKARRSTDPDSSFTSAFANSSMFSIAGSETDRRQLEVEAGSSSLECSSGGPCSSEESFISLSEIDRQTLDEYSISQTSKGEQATPKERFGIQRSNSQAGRSGRDKANTLGASANSIFKKKRRKRGDQSLPSSLAGKLQAGLNEPGGGLPPEHGQLTRSFTFDSSNLAGGTARTSLEVAASGNLAEVRIVEEGNKADKGQVIPLEKGMGDGMAPIITPSEEVVRAAGQKLPVKEAIEEAVGQKEPVNYEELEEASNWARFASAVYAVMPFTEQGVIGNCASRVCVCHKPVTEESVRDAVVSLANIEVEDLLYFSHSNSALAHLPYMVALDRKNKAVVVAIRGTMSLADLVTDAVVHPESLEEWLSEATRKAKRKAQGGHKKAYAHAGITRAAQGVLEDLEVHGILHTLLQPDWVRRKSAEYLHCMNGSGAQPTTAPCKSERGHGSGAGSTANGQNKEGNMRKDTAGPKSGGVWPLGSQTPSKNHETENETAEEHRVREERDAMASAARDSGGTTEEQGKSTGAALQEHLDNKEWQLVLTGHSLGAGAAALISMKIHDRYPDLKCWAFSPPGGLVSKSLVGFTESWCTSVVVGKDAVPRMSVNNLNRLMDEMVTSLARCRYPKLRVLLGGWWRKESRPPPQHLFHSYRTIPPEARSTLERYHKSTARKGRGKDMFPPGKVMFVRPIKTLEKADRRGEEKRMKQAWDAVWITSEELIAEGILVSKKMLDHHSITSTLIDSLGYASRHHPQNPKSEAEKQEDKREQQQMQDELEEVRVDDQHSPLEMLSPEKAANMG